MSATSPQARPAVLGTIPGDTVCSFSSVVSAFSVGMTGGGSAGPGKLKVDNLRKFHESVRNKIINSSGISEALVQAKFSQTQTED